MWLIFLNHFLVDMKQNRKQKQLPEHLSKGKSQNNYLI